MELRLNTIEFSEFKETSLAWSLEKLSLGDINLLVGKNATGKSRSINVIVNLARLVSGKRRMSVNGDFATLFFRENGNCRYELTIGNGQVTREDLYLDEDRVLHRGDGGLGRIRYDDEEFNKESKTNMLRFQVPGAELAVLARRGDNVQHPFLQPLYDWGDSVWFFEFGKAMGHFNFAIQVNTPPSMSDAANKDQVVVTYNLGCQLQGEQFAEKLRADMQYIGYDIENFVIERPKHMEVNPEPPGGLLGISAKEKDLNCRTEQPYMSQGMFRCLSLLSQVNYAVAIRKLSCLVIDDIGEGLDFERSRKLIDLMRKKARDKEFRFQLVMATNDRFVMNRVPLEEWCVLQRIGSVVHVRNYENSKEEFERFKETGLSNFDLLASNYLG